MGRHADSKASVAFIMDSDFCLEEHILLFIDDHVTELLEALSRTRFPHCM